MRRTARTDSYVAVWPKSANVGWAEQVRSARYFRHLLVRLWQGHRRLRERAAICAWRAERTASAEDEGAPLYLQQMWILAAEVAEIIEGNGSTFHSDPPHLPSM